MNYLLFLLCYRRYTQRSFRSVLDAKLPLHLTRSLHGDVTYRDSSSNVPGDYTVAYNYVLTHHWTNRLRS